MHKHPDVKQLWIECFSIIYLCIKLFQPKLQTPRTDICSDRTCVSPVSPGCGIQPCPIPVPRLRSWPWSRHQASCPRRRSLLSSSKTSFTALHRTVSLHNEQGNTYFCLRLIKNWSKTPICANVRSADGFVNDFGPMSSSSVFLHRTGKIQAKGSPEWPGFFPLSEFLQGIPQPIS